MQFIEINREDMPILNPVEYPDYYLYGEYEVGDRVFKLENTYLEMFMDEDVAMISMISLDNKGNLFAIKKQVDKFVEEYGKVGFCWVEGIRNEVFIKRLLKNYTILDSVYEKETDTITKIFTK